MTLKPGINPHQRDYDLRGQRRADVDARARIIATFIGAHPAVVSEGGARVTVGQVRAILFADDRVRRTRADNQVEGAHPLDGVLQMWMRPGVAMFPIAVRRVWPGLADQLDDAAAWLRASA